VESRINLKEFELQETELVDNLSAVVKEHHELEEQVGTIVMDPCRYFASVSVFGFWSVFTVRCTIVQIAVLQLHVVCPSL